jgi:hypothetical protein
LSDGRLAAAFAAVLDAFVVQEKNVLLFEQDGLQERRRRLFAVQQAATQLLPGVERLESPDPDAAGQSGHERHEDLEHEHLHARPGDAADGSRRLQHPRVAADVLVPVDGQHADAGHQVNAAEDADADHHRLSFAAARMLLGDGVGHGQRLQHRWVVGRQHHGTLVPY